VTARCEGARTGAGAGPAPIGLRPSPVAAADKPLREIATRIGALLIFDEVQTGFGRTGAWFAA